MVIYRPVPKCSSCGKPIAEGVYRKQSRIYGDAFIRWDYFKCGCKESKKVNERDRKEANKIAKKIKKLLRKSLIPKENEMEKK